MTWTERFIAAFEGKFRRKPNPLEVAHNLPKSASDSDAMSAMVEAMQRLAGKE